MYDLVVIGGGAAGVFGAIQACEARPGLKVLLLEATPHLLQKVRISGGGRCNVTHHQFDPAILCEKYPRGSRQLRAGFSRFQPEDMIRWLDEKGVQLKTEADGRMFPVSDDSQTIIDCFTRELEKHRVEVLLSAQVKQIAPSDEGFRMETEQSTYRSPHVLLATGSSRPGYRLAQSLGHTIVDPVPSLFTFKVTDPRIDGLAGNSSPDAALELKANRKNFSERGPLLITHWGFSGPALIRLSAWAARELHQSGYQARLKINWQPDLDEAGVREALMQHLQTHTKKKLPNATPQGLPKRYWTALLNWLNISPDTTWAQLSRKDTNRIVLEIYASEFQVTGKGVFKEEFVTCGGVATGEVDMKSMESRLCPGLFFAGEVLDIDGITGGFNFQSAWTTAWLAARCIKEKTHADIS